MTKEKGLHPRNIHNERYDFNALIENFPNLKSFVSNNKYGDLSVDFSNSNAVLTLNQAILSHLYQVKNWTIPKGNLCPPIPGRVDYIHHIADLLAEDNNSIPPVGTKIKGLDIGTGTGCIYPILGNSVYGWKMVGTEVNPDSINHCKVILSQNPSLKKNIKTRFQSSVEQIFQNIIKPDEKFDFTMCNPPFYSSFLEAQNASNRKVRNLNLNKEKKGHGEDKIKLGNSTNFGGKDYELWCPGGEVAFIKNMIKESIQVKDKCIWFTTLVSKKEHLFELTENLECINGIDIRTIKMNHGQKSVHILAWKFKN